MIALKALQFLFFNAMDACCRLHVAFSLSLHDQRSPRRQILLSLTYHTVNTNLLQSVSEAKLLEPSFDLLFVTMAAFALRRRSPVAIFLVRPSRATLPPQNYSSNDTISQLIEIIFSSPR